MLKRILKFGRKLSAPVLGSMLRLGRKYEIEHLENEALERLRHDYSTTLQAWDSLSYDRRRIEDDPESGSMDPITKIISIAHEFHLFTILPAAYAQYLQQQTLVVLFHFQALWFLILSFE
jgi:hypothetical protein